MIRIAVFKGNADAGDERIRIEISGHAGYAPSGQDIVCAAVSAIIETCLLGLQAIAEKFPAHVHIED